MSACARFAKDVDHAAELAVLIARRDPTEVLLDLLQAVEELPGPGQGVQVVVDANPLECDEVLLSTGSQHRDPSPPLGVAAEAKNEQDAVQEGAPSACQAGQATDAERDRETPRPL